MKSTKSKKPIIKLILILIFALFIRFIFLDKIPVGINDDELHFVLKAKSFFYGQTISFDEMSSVIFSPIIGLLPLNLVTARLPYIVTSVLSIILLYLIVKKITKNTNLSIFVVVATSLNPWSIYTARTSFDAPVALLFFLLSLYLMLKDNKFSILLSIPIGFLAFHSYIGTKVIYFPFIFISAIYCWKFINKKFGIYYLATIIFSLIITLNFAISLSHQSVGRRLSELWTPSSPKIAAIVNDERRESLNPTITLFTNKYTIYFREAFEKYLNNFSPNVMFLNGDAAFTGSLWIHGYFYYLDIILIILGMFFLFQRYRSFFLLITSFILLSPIPEAIRGDSIPAYVFHSSLQYPFLFILVGAGLFYFFQIFKSKLIRIGFIFLYLLSFANFLNIYFLKAPVYQSESFVLSYRLISKYLSFESKNNKEIYFLTHQTEPIYHSFLFYTNSLNRKNLDFIKDEYNKKDGTFNFKNIHFINETSHLPKDKNYVLIYDVNQFNFDNLNKIYINQIASNNKIFAISNGSTCQNIQTKSFVSNFNISDLEIEKMNENYFCTKFISQ